MRLRHIAAKPPEVTSAAGIVQVEPPCLRLPFRSGVWLPSGEWEECAEVHRSSPASKLALDGRSIFLVQLPQTLLEIAYEAAIRAFGVSPDYSHLERGLNESLTQGLAISLEAELNKHTPDPICLTAPVIVIHVQHLGAEPSLAEVSSTTRDTRTACGLRGLHVDNWQRPLSPPAKRNSSPYKALYNIGTAARSFVFSPFTVTGIARICTADGQSTTDEFSVWARSQRYATPMVEDYLSHNRDAQLIRITYAPGTCLLVPVHNLIHDGYPRSMRQADICFHARADRSYPVEVQ